MERERKWGVKLKSKGEKHRFEGLRALPPLQTRIVDLGRRGKSMICRIGYMINLEGHKERGILEDSGFQVRRLNE